MSDIIKGANEFEFVDFKVVKESMKNFKMWEICNSKLEFISKIGNGLFGRVYQGKMNFKNQDKKVAIKVFSATRYKEFKIEYQILQSLKSSPFLITFHGVSIMDDNKESDTTTVTNSQNTQPQLCMVLEYCSRDTIWHIMNNKSIDIGWNRFFQFTMQITLGLQSLHNRVPSPIIHRDINSLNILVNEDWECKLSNFGTSRFHNQVLNSSGDHFINQNSSSSSNNNRTFAYCSPESTDNIDEDDNEGSSDSGKSNDDIFKLDIYSIGIVFWELINRIITSDYSTPYSEYLFIKNDFQIIDNSKKGLRPTLPLNCPIELKNLYSSLIHQSPKQRPTTSEIIISLNSIRSIYLSNKSQWDNLIQIKK